MKPLAGKRAFYSMGQRSLRADYMGIRPKPAWPTWARYAFSKGQDDERFSQVQQTVKTWPASKLVESVR